MNNGKGASHGNDKLVIVPDTCSLIMAEAEIPEHFFINDPKKPGYVAPEKRPKHYYDIYLRFLPHSKIQGIHVLDAVGAELFGRRADGTLFDPSFNDEKARKNHPNLKGLATAIYSKRNDFVQLQETKQGKALIDVLASIAQLQQDIDAYLKSTGNGHAVETQKEILELLKKARKKLTFNGGEHRIHDYILKHPQPTFFISDDKNAREQVIAASPKNHHGCIYVDNTVGFLTLLKDAGILQQCGFEQWVSPEQIIVSMLEKEHKRITGRALNPDLKAIAGKTAGPSHTPKPAGSWFER